jgi:hypothetical protein
MSRLMSVSLTEPQVRAQSKTVTRRLGWWEDKNGRRLVKPGDTLTLCRKVMGRKKGDPLVRICDVEVVHVWREPLVEIRLDDVEAEGFPEWTRWQFIDFFCSTHKGCTADTEVTRIEWRYL